MYFVENKGKELLHDWMHSRYGVFDEHPVSKLSDLAEDPTAIDQQQFYHSSESTYEAVRYTIYNIDTLVSILRLMFAFSTIQKHVL